MTNNMNMLNSNVKIIKYKRMVNVILVNYIKYQL